MNNSKPQKAVKQTNASSGTVSQVIHTRKRKIEEVKKNGIQKQTEKLDISPLSSDLRPVSNLTNIDKLINELDILSTFYVDDWKISNELHADQIIINPYRMNFDDSKWGKIKLKDKINKNYCWIRKTIILPRAVINSAVEGKVTFSINLTDAGCVWINQECKGYFYKSGNFILAENAKPGEKFIIVIEAFNTSDRIRFNHAELIFEDLNIETQKIKDLILSLSTGQKLLSFDTYQTSFNLDFDPQTDKSKLLADEKIKLNNLLQALTKEVNVNALKNGNFKEFWRSIDKIRPKLKPISKYAKKFTLYFTSNAHIDAAWLWRYKETIKVCYNTFSSVFNIMSLNKNFTYTQSSAQYYEWMEKLYPKVFQKIREKIQEGRWEIIGGQWIETDCNLPDGVSWFRQSLYAQDYFKRKFGRTAKIGWNPDSFGYNLNMPMFFRNSGIDTFITQKISWNDTNFFPYRFFWWVSPDNSKVLTYLPFNYDCDVSKPFQLIDQLRQFESNTGFRELMILFGVGDHGGGPTLEMLNNIEQLKNLDIFPKIEYGTASKYLNRFKKQNLSKLPIWKDELYLEFHRGTYTSISDIKYFNRKNEILLTQAEKYNCLSGLFEKKNYDKDLNKAWKKVIFNQFHDILPGSSIQSVYSDAKKDYSAVQKTGRKILNNSFRIINQNINTSIVKTGIPITIYNPLSWKRTDIVVFKLSDNNKNDYSVYDLNGKEIVSQNVWKNRFTKEILFVAEGVPPLGYKTYVLKKEKSKSIKTSLDIKVNSIQNEFFNIELDSSSGWIKQITDKRNGKKILTDFGNKLELLGDSGGAWNIKYTGILYPFNLTKVKIIERGPVRAILRLYREYPANGYPSSFIKNDIILYNGIDRIDFKLYVDINEPNTMLKVAFPVAVRNKTAVYEIPYGTIRRSTRRISSWEKARFEVPAEKWADLSDNEYGVSLLNNSKYGYDIRENIMRLSLLRIQNYPANYPDKSAAVSDTGRHIIDYSIYPHKGNWKHADTFKVGYNFNQPLIAVLNTVHTGKLKGEKSFITLEGSNLILTSIKKALNSDTWVIQWFETIGRNTDAVLTLPEVPKKVFRSNFLEENLEPLKFNDKKIKIITNKFSVITIKIYF
jgi:alpha-mannosidase